MLSSDAIELQGLCDRVSVFSRGGIARTLTGDEITEKNIIGAAITADTQRVHSAGILDQRRTALHRFVAGDYAPTMILLALILIVGVYTNSVSPHFFTGSYSVCCWSQPSPSWPGLSRLSTPATLQRRVRHGAARSTVL